MNERRTGDALARWTLPAALASLLGAAACGGPPGAPVAELEFLDLPAPAMYRELARGLDKPYVLELPPPVEHPRHDLRLSDTNERDAVKAIDALDPRFDVEIRPDVLLVSPGEEFGYERWTTRRLEGLRETGGAADVLASVVVAADLGVRVSSDATGRSRPVQLELEGATVRDALALVAVQAHVGLTVLPGEIQLEALPGALP